MEAYACTRFVPPTRKPTQNGMENSVYVSPVVFMVRCVVVDWGQLNQADAIDVVT